VLLCFDDPRVRKIRNDPVALGSSPELFAFTVSLAPPVRCDLLLFRVVGW